MNTAGKNKIPFDLISRYLSGEADAKEIASLEDWKLGSKENQKIFNDFKKLWEKSGQTSLLQEINIDSEWEKFKTSVSLKAPAKEKNTFTFYLYRIAAVIIIGLVLSIGGYYGSNSLKYETIYAGTEVLKLDLPDGSVVDLNRNSKLKYTKRFAEDRKIRIDGEAFFTVVKDSLHPFIVSNKKLFVEVIGTSFNVRAFDNEATIDIIVEEGKVAVYEAINKSTREYLLKGDRLVYEKESGKKILDVKTDSNLLSWKTGKLHFSEDKLGYVLSILEKHFGVEFSVENQSILSCPISVKFEDKDLNYILSTIAKTLDLTVSREGSRYIIRGEGC